ncbi:MAG: heat shock protein HspQ [Pseudomonadota bacterium]|nr:heat shock protein HspQ [Pseudomonadota bacterium]
MENETLFFVGQLVYHKLFNYRGVIVDVDPVFMHTEEWYEQVAKSRPPKDQPWYHVLVHDSQNQTYVAQRNLQADNSDEPINHPELSEYFTDFIEGKYVSARKMN